MVNRRGRKDNKDKQKVNEAKISQLELTQTTEKNNDMVEQDNESVNIEQIVPKKYSSKISYNTLATSHFSISTNSGKAIQKTVRLINKIAGKLYMINNTNIFQNVPFKTVVQTDKVISNNISKPSCIVDKLPEMASLSSVSAATPTHITSNNKIIPLECKEIYRQMTSNVIAERELNIKSIGDFVKDQLFKRLKFYYAELLLYDTKKNSICQKVCTHLNMAEAGKASFWSKYSPCVESAIRIARNDAIQAMKNSFLGGKSIKQKILDNNLNTKMLNILYRLCQSM